jgi:uncharacterized damage-inducible protein DinB
MKSHFLHLFEYDYWANQQVWQSMVKKSLSNPKIENLFSHLLSAQGIWLNRCIEVSEILPLWDTQSDLKNFIITNHKAWIAFLEKLEDSDFEKIITYFTTSGVAFQTKLKDILTHLINHGTYHRGQIVQLLKNEREILPVSDYILWVR